jgi:hypothetical protein
MGLTIHYTLKSTQQDLRQVESLVQAMRQLALDLPFEQVGPIVDLKDQQCNFEARRAELQNGDDEKESLFWLLIQASGYARCPWNRNSSYTVYPNHVLAFSTWPGPGSEAANFGLCCYPAQIDRQYDPQDDQRSHAAPKPGQWPCFSYEKYRRLMRRRHKNIPWLGELRQLRQVPTKLEGWRWRSCCKTQYASNPEYGGLANFLRCHISVITLLDRMARLPGLKVVVDDEGHYGAGTRADDWDEARAAGRRPTYRRHRGRYSPVALARTVGEWNEMMSGFAGALGDVLASRGVEGTAAIKDFPNFEQLEFRGRQRRCLAPFLQAMTTLAKAQAT